MYIIYHHLDGTQCDVVTLAVCVRQMLRIFTEALLKRFHGLLNHKVRLKKLAIPVVHHDALPVVYALSL